jgi:hypothetical protein
VDMEDPKLREAAESLGRDLVKDETPAGPLRHVVIVALAGEGEDERLAIGGSNGIDKITVMGMLSLGLNIASMLGD